jgi:hypothetical protein
MALFREGIEISATIDNITLYPLFGNTYMRKKSSLTRKKVLTDKNFEKTRQCAAKMGLAAQIGSKIYRTLPADMKERWLYRAITGEAASMLYAGKEEQEVTDLLWKKYVSDTGSDNVGPVKAGFGNNVPSNKKSRSQFWNLFLERWKSQGKTSTSFKHAWDKRSRFFGPKFREALDHTNGRRRKSALTVV